MKRRYSLVLIGLALSAFFPAYLWYQPEHARVWYVFTIGFALACYIPWIKNHTKKGWIALVAVAIWGLFIETIGITTCFPYGCFAYSEQLWPSIAWWAPRLLLATYPPLVLWIYQYLRKLDIFWRQSRLMWGFGLMLVDFILDPIAVQMGLWSYPWGGLWFGVPVSNFLWRILSGTISMIILNIVLQKHYNPEWEYRRWLWLNLSFFIWYTLWKFIL